MRRERGESVVKTAMGENGEEEGKGVGGAVTMTVLRWVGWRGVQFISIGEYICRVMLYYFDILRGMFMLSIRLPWAHS